MIKSSWLAVQALNGELIGGHRTVAGLLPTQFAASLPRLDELLGKHNPVMVICVGQAPRAAISLERVAINVDDARIPDNAEQAQQSGSNAFMPLPTVVRGLRTAVSAARVYANDIALAAGALN